MTPSVTVAPHATCVDACNRPSFCEYDQFTANPNDCTNYYRCTFNEWVLQECGSGLYFDSGICVCNLIANCPPECPPTTRRPTFQPSKSHVYSTIGRTIKHYFIGCI